MYTSTSATTPFFLFETLLLVHRRRVTNTTYIQMYVLFPWFYRSSDRVYVNCLSCTSIPHSLLYASFCVATLSARRWCSWIFKHPTTNSRRQETALPVTIPQTSAFVYILLLWKEITYIFMNFISHVARKAAILFLSGAAPSPKWEY